MSLKTAFTHSQIEPFYTGGPVSLTADGKYLASTKESDVIITNLVTGDRVLRVQGDEDDNVCAMKISPDGMYVIICTTSLRMKIIKIQEEEGIIAYRTLKVFKPHESPVMSLAIDPTSTLVATGGAEGLVKVWDIAGGYSTHNFLGHGGVITALQFYGQPSSGIWKLASGSEDCKVRLWDLVKKKCSHVLDSHVSVIRGLDFSDDGKTLISGSRDRVVSVWNVSNGKLINTIPVLESIEVVGYVGNTDDDDDDDDNNNNGNGNNDRLIYTGGENGQVKLWSEDGKMMVEQNQISSDTSEQVGISDICISKQGGVIYSVLTDNTILELDIGLSIQRRLPGEHGQIIDCCFVGQNSERLVIATNSPEVRLIDLREPLSCEILSGHTDIVLTIDKSADGLWLATAGKDNEAKLWRLYDDTEEKREFIGECMATFKGHAASIGAIGLPRLATTKNKQNVPSFLITGSIDLTIKKWDPNTQRALYTRKAHEGDINAIDVSSDDKLFATASHDKTVKIWDCKSGEVIGVLKGHRRGVWSVKFNKFDRSAIVTASVDKTVKLWNLNEFSCIRTFEGHSNSIYKVAWLSQGLQIISGGGDGLVKIWDTKTGECNCTLDNHEDRVWCVAIKQQNDDNDKVFVSGGGDSVITVWTDNTELVRQEQDMKRIQQIEKEQELDNYVNTKDWKRAIIIALELDQPYKLLSLFRQLIVRNNNNNNSNNNNQNDSQNPEINSIISQLQSEQIIKLLYRLRDWNTTAKTSEIAQYVFNSILHCIDIDQLSELKGVKPVIDSMIPYSQRHYARFDDLLQQSYSLDYVLEEMLNSIVY